jgi:hypothetical protein
LGFDDSLTGPGLLVWRINEPIVQLGLASNNVNSDPNNPGIYLVQADGLKQLDDASLNNRGDQGDPFPGASLRTEIDSGTTPSTTGKLALCNIAITPDAITLDIFLRSKCDE